MEVHTKSTPAIIPIMACFMPARSRLPHRVLRSCVRRFEVRIARGTAGSDAKDAAVPDADRLAHEPPPTPPSVRRFGALGYPEFRLLWFGLAISNTGSWMATLAQGWLVVELAPRPALAPLYLGIIGFVRSVPVVLVWGVAVKCVSCAV